MDGLLQEGHSDALLVVDFEAATQETIQEDEELAMAFTASASPSSFVGTISQ